MSAHPAAIMTEDRGLVLAAPPGTLDKASHGIDDAFINAAYARLTLSETGEAETNTTLFETPTHQIIHCEWREKRHDGQPGRFLRISHTTSRIGGRGVEVSINSCFANASSKRKGFARETLAFAATLAAPYGAPINITAAKKDGPAAWLVLGGQPLQDELDSAVRRMHHRNTPRHIIAAAKAREFVELRKKSPTDFAICVQALGSWEGGWTPMQARQIARAANEGLR